MGTARLKLRSFFERAKNSGLSNEVKSTLYVFHRKPTDLFFFPVFLVRWALTETGYVVRRLHLPCKTAEKIKRILLTHFSHGKVYWIRT